MEAIGKFWLFLKRIGLVKKDLPFSMEEVQMLQAKTENLIDLLDRFNSTFSERGWIAYESLNTDLMRRAVDLAERGSVEEAEEVILSYYLSEEKMRFHLLRMKGLRAWHPRAELADKAMQDFLEGRYHACVPVVLALMDGLVSDVATTGMFAEGTELAAWDSVAGHSSGLKVLYELFKKGRRRTTTEPIDLPYRNGILHGRDLGYANEKVAAKCWAALFAIRDWAGKLESEPRKKQAAETENKGFFENLRGLAETAQQLKRNEEVKNQLADWKPRERSGPIEPGEALEEGTPEGMATRTLQAWQAETMGILRQVFLT